MKNSRAMKSALIAPCGMNCRLCRAFMRDRNVCPGCRGNDGLKSKAAAMCRIRNCEMLLEGKVKFCYTCRAYPCKRVTHLDRRYRMKYGMSMIDNLEMIKHVGIRSFVKREEERWACAQCGEMLCVHKERCVSCDHKWR